MAKRKTVVAFKGTAAQEQELRESIARHKGEKGALMPVLQEAQEIYGYLPIEVQFIISQELNLALEKVYEVVTFYSQFTLNPKGLYNISICMGTACYVKGAGEIVDRVSRKLNIEHGSTTPDGLFSLDCCRCIGACGLAPVMVINEDVYGQLKPEDVDGIIDKYINMKNNGGQAE